MDLPSPLGCLELVIRLPEGEGEFIRKHYEALERMQNGVHVEFTDGSESWWFGFSGVQGKFDLGKVQLLSFISLLRRMLWVVLVDKSQPPVQQDPSPFGSQLDALVHSAGLGGFGFDLSRTEKGLMVGVMRVGNKRFKIEQLEDEA